ncbi:hypothetical protein [Actinobacillus minor]|uniref:hypothetical protein n=1 Tax=Actinobacillus minor TaxID=51047 RepID=UPI0023EF659C|nr:hypothetical protein [Actinobacillus minor]MDD6910219.1 hypothetical protein [Actinobacillus minor]
MQKQDISWTKALLWLCYLCVLLAVFSLLVHAFWQSGFFTSWLSSVGYVVLAFFITLIVNVLLITIYFAFHFCYRLLDRTVDFTFPQTTKAAK